MTLPDSFWLGDSSSRMAPHVPVSMVAMYHRLALNKKHTCMPRVLQGVRLERPQNFENYNLIFNSSGNQYFIII